jgi:phasin family protein
MDNPSKLFDDIAKLAQQYKMPGIDIDAVLQGRRKDVETLLEVGRITQSGAESLAQKQAEMLRASLEDLRSVLSAQGKTEGAKPDAVRQAAEKAIGNFGELAQIALKSQSAAFDAVRQRTQENINELKGLLSKAK